LTENLPLFFISQQLIEDRFQKPNIIQRAEDRSGIILHFVQDRQVAGQNGP